MLHAPLKSFLQVRRRISDEARFAHPWVCKAGLWPASGEPNAVVLKLLKQHWSPDPPDAIDSTIGIFFSVWINASAIAKGGLHYNLHALKLRQLAGYRLESRKFAAAFRGAFQPISAAWPGVDTQFGPQTLFQGFIKCPANQIEVAAIDLSMKFAPVGDLIDELLADATNVAKAVKRSVRSR